MMCGNASWLLLLASAGACPAGGCCMALACDLRFMTENGAIGLNEVALGIPVPDYWAQLMVPIPPHPSPARSEGLRCPWPRRFLPRPPTDPLHVWSHVATSSINNSTSSNDGCPSYPSSHLNNLKPSGNLPVRL